MNIDFDDEALRKNARAGREQKGDLVVEMSVNEEAKVVIELESSVQALYGEHIQSVIQDTLTQLGLLSIVVRARDFGAFDHVIQARVEAVARQLFDMPEQGTLPERMNELPPIKKNRLRRTRLYLPGNNPDFMINSGLFCADCVILDLEDSVAASEKEAARILVRNALLAVDSGSSERIVRINPLSTFYGAADLEMVIQAAPDTILIPKCESVDDVTAVEELVQYHEHRLDPPRTIHLMPLIETAKGVLDAYNIATASDRNVALCFGAEDFSTDIGVERTPDGTESLLARQMVVLASKAAGIQALDSVYSDLSDTEGLIRNTQEAVRLGFDGKGVIHPEQIKHIHAVFIPSEAQVEHARKVIEAFKKAEEMGAGVASLGTKMIDAPVVARAARVLALAEANRD